MTDAWEAIRHFTLDQFVRQTKLSSSALQLNGFTTPEKWPFSIVIAVGKPGNELGIQFAKEFFERMSSAAQSCSVASAPGHTCGICLNHFDACTCVRDGYR